MLELKPCPFCGSNLIMNIETNYKKYGCMCYACVHNGIETSTELFYKKIDAIKAWNNGNIYTKHEKN